MSKWQNTLTKVKCIECGRVFDLTNSEDEADWSFGHDCEEVEQ